MTTIPFVFIILTHKRLPHILAHQKANSYQNQTNDRQAEFARLKYNLKNASVQLQSLLQEEDQQPWLLQTQFSDRNQQRIAKLLAGANERSCS
ncbi:MAG: hypothetical protein NTW12_11015 [Deltaproteobacteria bacterium]|nr:hypothetical protein [Deltaproteobacteria bacterium]